MNESDKFKRFCGDYKLNGFSFPSITTEKKREKWDKKVNWGDVRWQKNKNSEIKDSHKGFAIRTGKDSDITVIDCDNIEVYNKITNEYPSLLNTLRIKTNRGYHLYLKYNEVFKSNSDSFINFGNYKGLDIRNDGGIAFSYPTTYYHNGEKEYVGYTIENNKEIIDIPDKLVDIYKLHKNISIKKEPINKRSMKNKETNNINFTIDNKINMKEVNDIANNINVKYLTDNYDWLKIITSLYTIGTNEALDIAKTISKKANNYDGDYLFEKKWNKELNSTDITLGTLFYYSEISNEGKHNNIKSKYFDYKNININSTEKDIAELAVKKFGNDFIFENNYLYHYNGVYWKRDNTKHYIKKSIMNDLTTYYKYIQKNIINIFKNTKDETTLSSKDKEVKEAELELIIKTLKECILLCSTNTKIKNIVDLFEVIIEKDELIKWEMKPYYYVFDNKIFDLESGLWVEPKKEDYLFISCGYNYENSSEEDKEKLLFILNDIFPIEEEKEYYLYILSSMMIGRTLDKFIVANGEGGNGKSVLHELILEMLKNYGYVLSNDVLITPMKGGPNPQVANLMYKRGVITREPDDSAGFCLSTIKELTGGSKINARLCNSNDTDIRICMTLIDESNKKPFIKGRIDNSAVRRIIDIPFRSIFVSKEEVNEYQGDNIKEGNKNLTTDIFREKYKLPLFEILKDYAKKLIENGFDTDKYKPKSIKERTMEYLQDSDRFLTYFTEEYERDNDKKSFIELSETYNRFKNSEFYNSLSRKDKIQWTKKYYIQNIKENILLRKDFCERHFYIDEQKQKQQPRNVLLSWKKKLIN